MGDFKIGDKIRCIKSISEDEGGPSIGETFIVTSVDEDNYVGFPLQRLHRNYSDKIKDGSETNWGGSCFKLVRRSSDSLKADSEILITEDHPNGSDLKTNDKCVVKKITPDYVTVVDSNGETWNLSHGYRPAQFETGVHLL